MGAMDRDTLRARGREGALSTGDWLIFLETSS
jgi:hypothetical protein